MFSKSRSIVVRVCLLLVLSGQLAVSAPTPYWWNQLFGVAIRPYHGQPQTSEVNNRRPRDRFKAICRVISGDNYAFPGNVPFPSAPFCPHGDKWWRRASCHLWSYVNVQIEHRTYIGQVSYVTIFYGLPTLDFEEVPQVAFRDILNS